MNTYRLIGSGSMEDGVGSSSSVSLSVKVREALQPTSAQWNDWKWHFRNRFVTARRLEGILALTDQQKRQIEMVGHRYPFSITPHYLSLARGDISEDPILRQAIPSVEECLQADAGDDDPLEEVAHSPVPGLVHRYPDRALLTVTNLCPVLCRFCTRKREWHKGGWIRSRAEIATAVEYIRRTRAIRDVIVSGGDPLILGNSILESLLAALRSIPHVEIIRIGTRVPVVLPQRIDAGLCEVLDRHGPIWLNTHFNHPNEITPESAAAVRALLRAGVPVNNQSVLLKGVNDSLETQTRLNQSLLRIGVRPYYLYQADDVRGTEHFRTPLTTGLAIVAGMRGHTSGLAVPTFVVDLAGGGGKVALQTDNVVSWEDDEVVLRNYEGRAFRVRNSKADGDPRAEVSELAPAVTLKEAIACAACRPRRCSADVGEHGV